MFSGGLKGEGVFLLTWIGDLGRGESAFEDDSLSKVEAKSERRGERGWSSTSTCDIFFLYGYYHFYIRLHEMVTEWGAAVGALRLQVAGLKEK